MRENRIKTVLLAAFFILSACAICYSASGLGQQYKAYLQGGAWGMANGEWIIDGPEGILRETSGRGKALHAVALDYRFSSLKDCVLEADVRIDSGSYVGIIFRVQKNPQEYYVFYINTWGRRAEFWKHMAGSWDSREKICPTIALPENTSIVAGRWYRLKVAMVGNIFMFYLDGNFLAEFKDNVYQKGLIGVWTWNSTVSFKDVAVTLISNGNEYINNQRLQNKFYPTKTWPVHTWENPDTGPIIGQHIYPDIVEKAYQCQVDSDCVRVAADCCGCQAGGSSIAINKTFLNKWQDDRRQRCKNIKCAQVYKCQGQAVCVNNRCVLQAKNAE